MKKSAKKVLCGVLSLAMCSTIAVESVLRLFADNKQPTSTTTVGANFTDVSGQFDVAKLREAYFNDSVLQSAETAQKHETRTVMITLSKEDILSRASGTPVAEYLDTFTGSRAKSEIENEQSLFFSELASKGIDYEVEHTYTNVVNAVAIKVNTKHLAEIRKMKGVESAFMTSAFSVPQTSTITTEGVVSNETQVYDTGIYNSSEFISTYGAGMVVAVLDTGLDYTHPAFQGFMSANVMKDNAATVWTSDVVDGFLKNNTLAAEVKSGALEMADVYVSDKVPFAYDYADDDPDVYPSYSNHGTHVAGIIGGYDPSGYTDKEGVNSFNKTDLPEGAERRFLGVVPDAQLMICKVFTDDLDDPDLGGAVSEDIVAALDDCVMMGVDVINMSLGSSCGFTTTNDMDQEGEMLNRVYSSIGDAGISLICAASNDYSAGYGGVYGTNLASNPDAGTVGSPSTFASALSVASINGQKASYFVANADDAENKSFVFFEEARDINSNPLDFVADLKKANTGKTEYEYVVVPGVGKAENYSSKIKRLFKDSNGNKTGRIALIQRGETTFQEKVELAMEMGAAGVIIYNNVAGVIRMNLGEVENPVPSVSISMNAGNAMKKAAGSDNLGKLTISGEFKAGPFMSEFSSWGPTHDLKLKPEITAHGGEITSAVPGGYGEQSGTSMATPNMAGFMAIVRSYIEKELSGVIDEELEKDKNLTRAVAINRLTMQLTMSTAGMVLDQEGLPYSPRKQGAGVAKLENVVGGTKAYLSTTTAYDNRPKVELGDDDDREKKDVYTVSFIINNFGDSALSFKPQYQFMTETLSTDKLTVSEQAYLLKHTTAEWTVGGKKFTDTTFTVAKNSSVEVSVELTLGTKDKEYIDKSFKNGMYVEGFVNLLAQNEDQCDLILPFMGFYGDWDQAPMLDYTAYEVSKSEQDPSIKEEDKIKASVWETQPFAMYYDEKYILPMGSYLYLLPDDAEPMYISEEHNAVSRYSDYNEAGDDDNYMTTTGIKAIYAGLLRNARLVKYKLYDEATGEVILEDKINRVSKAYSGGGSAVPANVEVELRPEVEGLLANGRYKMTFEFFKDTPADGEKAREENTFEFSFTVDYDAPVLEDARVRFYNYKDGNKEKQRIYLDVDVYDNHYAQSLMLCYPTIGKDGETALQLATEYPTPIRDAVRNGTTTISLEITDIYEKYGDQLYLMIDDYSVNSAQYKLNIGNANASVLPEGADFGLAEGEEKISLDQYGTHKVALVYGENYKGTADISNFEWTSRDNKIAKVRNGEIVGISEGKTYVDVSNRKGGVQTIEVSVSAKTARTLPKVPSISFGIIEETKSGYLQKANGGIEVNAGAKIQMTIETDPWYHPMTDLEVRWTSNNTSVATVDSNGVVSTFKKGTATITANVWQKNANGEWKETLYAATSMMQVQNEFDVSNFTLNEYNGIGYTVDEKEGWTEEMNTLVIPEDLNVMYIGEDAFQYNDNIKRIIIPSTVVDIREGAFANCTALEEVYFVDMKGEKPATADVSMIYEEAFYNCPKLKLVDFRNVKTVTVARDAFNMCPNLATVEGMKNVGTMHHRAFAGSALKSVDISALHMAGQEVFANCENLTTITTGRFTAIGDYMFQNCTALENEVLIQTPKIGVGAFSGCENLAGVKFASPEGTALQFDIGEKAFENCGSKLLGLASFSVDFGEEAIRSIGARAFSGSSLKTLGAINGLEILGENAFANTKITSFELTDGLDIASVRLSGIPFKGLTVSVAEGSTNYADENGVIYALNENGDKTAVVFVNESVEGEFTLPATVSKIGAYAFANSKISKLTLTSAVSEMGVGAFENAKITEIDFNEANINTIPERAFAGSSLPKIELPASVQSVGDYAFANSSLAEYKGVGVKTMGSEVFSKCEALYKVDLGSVMTTMGDGVFYQCTALAAINLPALTEMGSYTFAGCAKLASATFESGATTTGTYTFAGTPIKTAVLGDNVKTIGEGAFYKCASLEEITLPDGIGRVGIGAFGDCIALTSVKNIEKVKTFEAQSFNNTAMGMLELDKAEEIGFSAFAVGDNRTATLKLIEIPVVKKIDSYAFYNNAATTLELPASLEEVGYAAFAASKRLNAFTVAEGENNAFFAKDGVLYRYTNTDKTEFELVAYPTARVEDGKAGERTYVILDGTTRVLAHAFYAINKDAVNAVVLPYSVNAIGDSAFFASGITEYTFESIVAPTLETVHRAEIQATIENLGLDSNGNYKGYYNTNFETYLYSYSSFNNEESKLVMNYPRNGSGYTNHVYTTYFGVRNPSEADLIEDNTRLCIQMVEAMPEATEVATWKTWDKTPENKSKVVAFGETMKTARLYYNNAKGRAGQAVFITEEIENKLLGIEVSLREVKKAHDVPFVLSELRVASDSTHKTEYMKGDYFDMTGLSLTLVYDDYSTEAADPSKYVLLTTGKLFDYDQYAEVSYEGTTVRVFITVNNPTVGGNNPVGDENGKGSGTVWIIAIVCVLGIGAVVGVEVFLIMKKKKAAKAAEGEAPATVEAEPIQEGPVESIEAESIQKVEDEETPNTEA